jgi:hypothetical protein
MTRKAGYGSRLEFSGSPSRTRTYNLVVNRYGVPPQTTIILTSSLVPPVAIFHDKSGRYITERCKSGAKPFSQELSVISL